MVHLNLLIGVLKTISSSIEYKILVALERQNFTNPTHDFFLQHLMRQQLVFLVVWSIKFLWLLRCKTSQI